MGHSDTQTSRYLALDKLAANSQLARRLPRDLAFRYHALPVAKDGDRITVAMANPDDPAAQAAVASALGALPYLVQSDRTTIDALLAEVWPESAPPALHFLVCASQDRKTAQALTCAQSMGALLNARLSSFDPAGDASALAEKVACVGHDLVIVGESCQPLIEQLLSGPDDCRLASCVPTSLLVVRQFRWPLKKIILTIYGAQENSVALDWVVRLARSSGAAVTVLAVVPSTPLMYGQRGPMRPGLTALLSTDTALGRALRQIAQRLVEEQIEGTLCLRQGMPDQQLQRELAAGDYDLVVVGADPDRWWQRWLMGGEVNSLLRWADQPVLIAKPNPGENGKS